MAGAAVGALLIAAACSSPPTRSSVPAPDDWTPEAGEDPLAGAANPLAPPETAEQASADEAASIADSDQGGGLIAAAGPTGLRFLRPDGGQVVELTGDQIVIQPTWSRDGRRLVATVINPSSGAATVAVVDVSTWEVAASPANREYFFYSWSHDGTRLAALGPGPSGGTSLDILDDSGMVASDFSPESGSVFVAWEPAGRRLLVHAGPQLLLVGDPDSPREHSDFGSVGFGFQAPVWVPGTQDFLYVDSTRPSRVGGSEANPGEGDLEGTVAGGAPRLVRRSVDSPELADLGDAAGLVLMSVHPEGRLAALSLLAAPPTSADPNSGAGFAFRSTGSRSPGFRRHLRRRGVDRRPRHRRALHGAGQHGILARMEPRRSPAAYRVPHDAGPRRRDPGLAHLERAGDGGTGPFHPHRRLRPRLPAVRRPVR